MVNLTRFDNGFTLVTEKLVGSRTSVAYFSVGAGSGNETPSNNGISHFTEHMMFKGTSKHTAEQIARKFEDMGVMNNAFTSREGTCYYVKSMDEYFFKALDLLTDILFDSVFPEEEVEKERGVICEEYNMGFDDPDDIVTDNLAKLAYKGCSLAYPIIGTLENIKRFSSRDIRDYMAQRYGGDNIVLSVGGDIDHEEMVKYVEKNILPRCLPATGKENASFSPHVSPEKGIATFEKDFKQVTVSFAIPGLPFYHDDSPKLSCICNALGGGMSSRLFQKMREEKGLVYNVYSAVSSHKNNGVFNVYFNTSGEKLRESLDTAIDCMRTIFQKGLSSDELKRQKILSKGSCLFAREKNLSVVSANAKFALFTGLPFDVEKYIERTDVLELDEVNAYGKEYFSMDKFYISAVGSSSVLKDFDFKKYLK